MRGRLDEIRSAGGELVLVGSGTPEQARDFGATVAGVRVLADPSLRAYRALDLKHSRAATLNPGSVIAGARSTLRGHFQGPPQGDPWQQGGLFVVSPGGEILFAQRYKDAGERPRLDKALAALTRPAPAGDRRGSPRPP